MLTIVLLLNSLNLLAQQNNINVPLRGSECSSDTAVAVVPINLLKKANVKMIERNYLININKEQDSIIIMKDKYINEQQKIIADFQMRVNNTNKLNESIKLDLERQKRKNKIISYGAGGVIFSITIFIIGVYEKPDIIQITPRIAKKIAGLLLVDFSYFATCSKSLRFNT